jgi:hypothetical protein
MCPLAAILTLPLQAVSLVFTYNVILILGFALSGLSMFALTQYVVDNKYASFISGLIFAFSPMHIVQSSRIEWASIEFIPLFLLFFLISSEKQKMRYSFAAAASFIFLTFFGDIEQGLIAILFVALFSCAYVFLDQNKAKTLIYSTGKILFFIIILGLPFFIPIFKSVLFSNALNTINAPLYNSLYGNAEWSLDLFSFFVPSPFNTLFMNISVNAITKTLLVYKSFPQEEVGYLGYSVIILCLLGLAYALHHKKFKKISPWVFASIIIAVLSLGPSIYVLGSYTRIPGPYLLLKSIPVFNVLREPGRLITFAFIGIALLASVGSVSLFEYARRRAGLKRPEKYIAVILAIIIIIEYNGIFPQSSANFENRSVPQIYYDLENVKCNCSVLALPYTQNNTATTMYFQTVFKKPMIGGYLGRENQTQYASLEKIPLIADSYVLNSNGTLAVPSQINGSNTELSLSILKNYKVGFIIFNESEAGQSYESKYLSTVFGSPVMEGNSTEIFSTAAAFDSK